MRLIHKATDKIRIQPTAILALLLLRGLGSPALLAQQPAAINREAQARAESPDRSVDVVDLDPEKAREDAAGQARTLQPYSTWGLQRKQAQKTTLDSSKTNPPASTWTHQSGSAMTTAQFQAEPEAPLRVAKIPSHMTKSGLPEKPRTQVGQPGSKTQRSVVFPQSAGSPLKSQQAAGDLDFQAQLAFDQTRHFSSPATLKTSRRGSTSHSKADPHCHSSTLGTQRTGTCAQSQKKRNRNISAQH